MISVAWRYRTGSSIGSFHDGIILRGLCYHFSYFQSFLTFSKSLFLQTKALNTSVKIDYGNFKLDPSENFLTDRQCWVSQDAPDVSYSNGLKILTKMVLEVDALPNQWQVNKFWRFGKFSCKFVTDNSWASPTLLFGMIFVNWFLFSSAMENVCSNLHYAAPIAWLLT